MNFCVDVAYIWTATVTPTAEPTVPPSIQPTAPSTEPTTSPTVWLTAETNLDYVLVFGYKTWSEANDYCATQYGTTLATIRNDDDALKMLDLFGSDLYAWIGLNDIETEGEWVWASGWECDGECIALDWWIAGNPDNWYGVEHCGLTGSHYTTTDIYNMIGDVGCSDSYSSGFICDVPSTSTGTAWLTP